MAEYKTHVTIWKEAKIDSGRIANILDEELVRILGDKDRYIKNGKIMERDYRFNSPDEIRDATEEEIKLYEAFRIVERHFRYLE